MVDVLNTSDSSIMSYISPIATRISRQSISAVKEVLHFPLTVDAEPIKDGGIQNRTHKVLVQYVQAGITYLPDGKIKEFCEFHLEDIVWSIEVLRAILAAFSILFELGFALASIAWEYMQPYKPLLLIKPFLGMVLYDVFNLYELLHFYIK